MFAIQKKACLCDSKMFSRFQNFTENIKEKVKDNVNRIKQVHLFNSKFGSNPFAEEDELSQASANATEAKHEQSSESIEEVDDDFVVLSTESVPQGWKNCLSLIERF